MACGGWRTPYPQKRQQTLGATLPGGASVCGKLLKALFLAVDRRVLAIFGQGWLFFVRIPEGHVFHGLQRIANNLSTEAPTDFVGNYCQACVRVGFLSTVKNQLKPMVRLVVFHSTVCKP